MKPFRKQIDLQVSILLSVFVAVVTITCFIASYNVTYNDMKRSLCERVETIYEYLEDQLDMTTFDTIKEHGDVNKKEYLEMHKLFGMVKECADVMYLYTARKNDEGEYIYVIDCQEIGSEDYRYPGDLIEEEIWQDMDRALGGEEVYPNHIVHTSWGDIFICYLPIYNQGKVVGVLGVEFEAEHQYVTYQKLKLFVPVAVAVFTILAFFISSRMFRHVNVIVEKEAEQKKELAEALSKAETASAAKSKFLFNMSHDIRTPLNAIVGFTQIAREHIDDKEKVMDSLLKVEHASRHLMRLINDVLDMAKIESGKLKLELELSNVSENAAKTEMFFRPKMEEKGLDFEVKLENIQSNMVWYDPLRIKQIEMNLLSNALEYTPSGGSVQYRLVQTKKDEQGYVYMEMHFKDTGVGMTEEFQKSVFGLFEREKSATESGVEGTGLGLAITKQLVELHNGTIELYSKKGVGTELIVKLRLKAAEDEEILPTQDEVKEEISFAGRRVLLAEDNMLNREIAEIILSDKGLDVECAADGVEAVEMLAQSTPGYYDLILMDIQMPNMDGYQATIEIRKLEDPCLAAIPVIAMTANAFEDDKKRAYEVGMNEYIPKPIEEDKLNSVLTQFLS